MYYLKFHKNTLPLRMA